MFSLQEFFDHNKPHNGQFFTIAIDGRGGSGKSTLSKNLHNSYPDINLLSADDYFEPIDDPIVWGDLNDKRINDEVIESLKTGPSYHHKPFDFKHGKILDKGLIKVGHAFCLDRVYSFKFDLDWDLKIWVDTPAAVCFIRALKRENLPHDRVVAAWKIWQSRENEYLKDNNPVRNADLVLAGTVPFTQQIV